MYCTSLDMCSNLYAHFLYTLKYRSYYPPGAEQISDNRLFGMFHSKTDDHNKDVIMRSMAKVDGVVQVVFAMMALGMGVDFIGLTSMIHYGAPGVLMTISRRVVEQEEVNHQHPPSTEHPPIWKDMSNPCNAEVAAIRRYLENTVDCRRYLLLSYFDPVVANKLDCRDKSSCCDNCRSALRSCQ